MTALLKDISALPDDLEEARRVLDLETKGLQALSCSLGQEFSAAVEKIYTTRGRVILTGMGKSGHIARKIASTFASTGTPSYFVHPAEASHGDLGMLTSDDMVIALSNSGETPELSDITSHSKRFGLKLVGITSNPKSTLAEMADTCLLLPKVEEACPLGLAPTTSTTQMIALGDALAIAVLRRKGFSAKDFGALHPGGKLGQRLLRVEALMHTGAQVPTVLEGALMTQALLEMTSKGLGCVAVTNAKGKLMGVITDGDLRRHLDGSLLTLCVNEVMTRDPYVISKEILAHEALAKMNTCGITSIFVTDGATSKPIGVLHIHDCLRAGL
jgi:arabinose-5-phosphate isomerase